MNGIEGQLKWRVLLYGSKDIDMNTSTQGSPLEHRTVAKISGSLHLSVGLMSQLIVHRVMLFYRERCHDCPEVLYKLQCVWGDHDWGGTWQGTAERLWMGKATGCDPA